MIPVIFLIAFLSGICGLGYEIVWTRALGLALGHESAAALAVIAAFFAGMAAGSLALAPRIARSPRPELWLSGLEALICGAAGVIALAMPWLPNLFALIIGTDASLMRHWLSAFLVTFTVLLPASFAMGGTLPALAAALRRQGQPRSLSLAYALNTAGAIAGTLAAVLVLLPAWGFLRTQLGLAALNALSAFLAWHVSRRAASHPAPAQPGADQPAHIPDMLRMALTGLLAIGFEIVCLRLLSQIFENTIYTFAAILAVFLAGNALGGALARSQAAQIIPRALLLAAAALASGAAILPLAQARAMLHALHSALGSSDVAAISAEAITAGVVLLPSSLVIGAIFARLADAITTNPGRVLAANLAGSAAAPAVFGVLMVPALGAPACLAIIAGLYALLAGVGERPAARAALFSAALALPGIALPLLAPPPQPLDPAGGVRIIAQRSGPTATVSVVDDAAQDRHLQINSHFRQGGNISRMSDTREAYLPLLLHGAPQRALFLGLGTGATIAASRDVPGLRADGVELVPEIIPLLSYFAQPGGPIENDAGITLHLADARRFVRASRGAFDVVIADLYFPAVDGAGALYTREHFAAIRQRLAPGGLFCQWLPLHQMDLTTLRPILRAFLAEFPDAEAWLAHDSVDTPLLGLIGGRAGRPLPPGYLARAGRQWQTALAANGLALDSDLTDLFVADAATLTRWVGPGPANTDDWPIATWQAPHAAYAPQEAPGPRLLSLLDALGAAGPAHLAGPDAARMQARRRAHRAFLAVGVGFDRRLSGRAQIDALVPGLLAVLRISPDYAAAYDPLLAMAQSLAAPDPSAALALLGQLQALAPARPEAAALRGRILPPGAAPGP